MSGAGGSGDGEAEDAGAHKSGSCDETSSSDEVDSSDEERERLETERLNFGQVFTKTSADRKQPVSKLLWTLVDHEKLPTTCERAKVDGHLGTEYGAVLLNTKEPVDDIYAMWKHLLPPTWIKKFMETANTNLQHDPVDNNYRMTCEAEVEAILGLELGAAVMGMGDFSKCFSVTTDPESLFPPAGFGQYGISKNRALIVGRLMHLSKGPSRPAGADPHWFIDEPLEEFNQHMSTFYRGSFLGTMDETGPMWHGKEGEDDFNMCPHVTFVPRKPEPVCAEFNDICCAISRVMLRMEFEKAAVYHKDEEYVDELGSYNAAMTTRLSTPFAHQNAAVYGDSRFGILKAAVKIWKKFKVHSAFDMKTGTSLFPRDDLIRLCPKEHGSLVVMTANIDDLKLYAIGQRRGPAVHTFLTTFGTFQKEVPKRFKNIERTEDAPWTTFKILNTITAAQPGIDVINRQLFDLMGMQYAFTTRCFETRFSKHFLMPVTYTNAANASAYHLPGRYGDTMTKPLLMTLAAAMVRNPEWLKILGSTPGGPGGAAQAVSRSGRRFNPAEKTWHQCRIDGGPPSRESPAKHVLILLSQLEGYKGAKQQRCWECNELVSWCCARCSSPASWLPLHPPAPQGSKKRYGCLAAHRTNPAGGYRVSHEVLSGTSKNAKRRRRIPMELI